MKKSLLLLLIISILQIPSFAAPKKFIPKTTGSKDDLPNIFIYSIPDDESETISEDLPVYINPEENNIDEEPVIMLEEESITIGASTLKGYAEYIESADFIHLKDDNDEYVLNLKIPQKITQNKGLNLNKNVKTPKKIQQYVDAEYLIAPNSVKSSATVGDFTFGAMYNNEVDNFAMLETETGLFTKYEKNKFALSSSVTKSLNTTYAMDYNTVSLTPELRLNNYMSLKNVLSADITRNRRSSKLVFSINPFGNKDKDRMEFEFGAKQTVYMDTDFIKTQFSFSTNFKL